ncbi:MAG: thiamine-phosphate kinase [Paludibacteraceae bacterium]|nr:thiamine-phosphate kinase [Paludibacteraceae bacterium]
MSRTEISTIGEFGLIDHINKYVKIENETTKKGIGDDAAVLSMKSESDRMLVTTDLMLEGIHFDLTYFPLKHLGYKAAMANFSDIYAMNAYPTQLTVSIGLSKRFAIEDVEEFYAGVLLACQRHNVDLVGGDTSSSLTGFTISMTCIGMAKEDEITYRSGAKPTDLICVSGNLGAAYMGLQLLEREKSILSQNTDSQIEVQPDFAGKEYIIGRQLKPEARRDIIDALKKEGIKPTSMIDISDEMVSDVFQICKESSVGCRIFEEKIPIDYETASMAEEFNMNLTTAALHGGDDYELLFTVPITLHEKINNIKDVKVIGYITDKEEGKMLQTRDGGCFDLKSQAWPIPNS